MSEEIARGPLAKLLLDIPLFEDLDYTQIGEIIDIATQKTPQSGEVLCESRTVDENLMVLLEGSLRLETASGRCLEVLEPVRVIGEMGVFTGQVRSSRIIVGDNTRVLVVPTEGLQELLEEDPQFANHVLSSLIKLLYVRLHDINDEMEHLHEKMECLKDRLSEVSPNDPLLAELFPE